MAGTQEDSEWIRGIFWAVELRLLGNGLVVEGDGERGLKDYFQILA